MRINLFQKSVFEELTEKDLHELVNNKVAEGYFVEFKSDFPSKVKIGNSVASLANTYGGWYFIGVEADKTNNVAQRICGFDLQEHADPIAEFRNIMRDYVSPPPVFYSQIIHLSVDKKGVLAVYIPDGQETPFISKDGRVYRRHSDSSDPVMENDRYTIDRLVDKGKEVGRDFERFCRDERYLGVESDALSWLQVFVSPYPLGTIDRNSLRSTESLRSLIKQTESIEFKLPWSDERGRASLPLNSGQITHQSVILRQTQPEFVAFSTLSAELFIDGRVRFLIPIQKFGISSSEILELSSNSTQEVLSKYYLANTSNFEHLSFFKIQRLKAVLCGLVAFYMEWLSEDMSRVDFKVGFNIHNALRLVPFIDCDEWGEYVKEFDLPVMHSDNLAFPRDCRTGWHIENEDDMPLWLRLINLVDSSFGIPIGLSELLQAD